MGATEEFQLINTISLPAVYLAVHANQVANGAGIQPCVAYTAQSRHEAIMRLPALCLAMYRRIAVRHDHRAILPPTPTARNSICQLQ